MVDAWAESAVRAAVEDGAERFVADLAAAVEIESVSNDPARHAEVVRMGRYVQRRAEELGAQVTVLDELGTASDGLPIPPVVLADFGAEDGESDERPTLCVYAHYDVMPAEVSDGWDTEPFRLELKDDGNMYGRGSTDDKGPLIAWLSAVAAHRSAGVKLPVRLKLVAEGREEAGSDGMRDALKHAFFSDVHAICISDNYWVARKPCLTYGLRGFCGLRVEVMGAETNLHSGIFGGAVFEPMAAMVQLLASLVDEDGLLSVPAVLKMVNRETDAERAKYDAIDFDVAEWLRENGLREATSENKRDVLMRRWRYPALSMHGIEASSDINATAIPGRVTAKMSIRTVASMDANEIAKLIEEHLRARFEQLGAHRALSLSVSMTYGAPAFTADFSDDNFEAARRAILDIHGVEPDFTREGGSIPVCTDLQQLGKSVCLLPIGEFDDRAHAPNEKFGRRNFLAGIAVMCRYMAHFAEAFSSKPGSA